MRSPLEKLNFELAYKRVCDELAEQRKSGRAFVAAPFEQELVEIDLDGWLKALKQSVVDGSYTPGHVEICGAPKGRDLIRPGTRMSLADRVVYTAAVGGCVMKIVAATKWSQRRVDFAPLFHSTHPWQRKWLSNHFEGWDEWTSRTLSKLDLTGTQFVVTADIAGYFENVSIHRLRSELKRVDCAPEIVDLISKCLLGWAPVRDCGLPQGVLASDVLAKLYLEGFDKGVRNSGYSHVRYVDDIRVFCRSRTESRRALVQVTDLLRERGLTVQSAKTKIREADGDLHREFAGAVPIIKALHQEYIEEALDAGVLTEDETSVPASVIDDLINAEPDAMDPEVFRRAFEQFVINEERPNSTMFKYLLRRMANSGDEYAVEYCSSRIPEAPETSPEILRYFEDLEDPRTLELPLRKALNSVELSMYPYTRFLILQWLERHGTSRAPTLKAVRKQAFEAEGPDYVRAAARAALARLGDNSDLERMTGLLSSSSDPLTRAQLLCCLVGLEKSRRNGIAGRLKSEKPWGERAHRYIMQGVSAG